MSFLPFSSKNKKTKISKASSFWADEWSVYDDDLYNESVYDDFTGTFVTKKMSSDKSSTIELLKLAAHRRAIANFVNILTNKNIKVKFHTKGDSYTNGRSVVLSADIKPEKFDVAVGLALHEASHINLTDFELFRSYRVPLFTREAFENKGISNSEVWDLIKSFTNWIEDRRIDQFIYSTCPGYREYYRALYGEYFNNPIIDKGLISDEFTDETIRSYTFRVINLTNPVSNLSKLKGLKRISNLIDVQNISRLKSTADSLAIAEGIADIIAECIDSVIPPVGNQPGLNNSSSQSDDDMAADTDGSDVGADDDDDMIADTEASSSDEKSKSKKQTSDETESSDDDTESDETTADGSKSDEDGDSDANSDSGSNDTSDESENEGSMGGGSIENQPNMSGDDSDDDTDVDANGTTGSTNTPKQTLSDKDKQKLDKQIQKQNEFLNDEIKKKSISKKDEKALDSVEKSGTELKPVGDDTIGGYHLKGTQCVVSKKLTDELMRDPQFPFASWNTYRNKFNYYNEEALTKGLQLGTLLGKRLAIRSEERVTENPRQKAGKIDKRLIAGLGYDYVNVFQTKEVDKFKKANLHISLDASGSMDGSKWTKTMITTIAICKAASMISNLAVQVSIRGTWKESPYVCLAYDSRVDKFDKVKRQFPYLQPGGTTPEGLAYQATMDNFVPNTNSSDSYFLNICDGEPYFTTSGINYSGWIAFEHTKKMVQKIKSKGVKVMAYYVSENSNGYTTSYTQSNFKTMYGDGSRFININDITEITKTLNQLFLTK